ncbi:histidine phosphatase family protein [Pseudolysinimonas sp.]|uniref:histidine phosphatase family protein n=1 Tax=Pseudolysinimonas sp. TaxID=2680009 RepID=UPI003F81BA52
MSADLVRLVRHGEVHNPAGVLYGRLPEFHLSDRGREMAARAAESLAGHDIRRVIASPLTRTRESAQPWLELFRGTLVDPGLAIDERLIEPTNVFEGVNIKRAVRANPLLARHFRNPWKPSWGEPFADIAARMMAAIRDAHASVDGGEVVLVSHQAPIWTVARAVQGKPLASDPRSRRCALSSITTVAFRDGAFVEVDYQEPAAELLAQAIDLGAV